MEVANDDFVKQKNLFGKISFLFTQFLLHATDL